MAKADIGNAQRTKEIIKKYGVRAKRALVRTF